MDNIFLSNRVQSVLLDNIFSVSLPVLSVIPQASVGLLFVIFINDITELAVGDISFMQMI